MSENKVLATVNGKEITQQSVNDLLDALGPQRAMQFYSEDGRKKLLDELIKQELIYLDAINKGMDNEEDFKLQLEKTKQNLLKQYALSKLMSNIKVEEEEIVNYYNDNKEQFRTDESIRAKHILVSDEDSANKVLNEINDGLSFEEAAQKYSNCPSKANGGDLNYFTRGKMVPEFEEAAFKLQKGEISKPVKTQFGYHLIKVVDKKEPQISKLEEVKDQLIQQLTAMKQSEVYTNKCNELKKVYEVKVN